MQIFKCLIKCKKFKGQNLIEFVFIIPLLIFMTLCIFEVALFWQDVNTIYSINNELNANAALINTDTLALKQRCPVATEATEIMEKKAPIVSMTNLSFKTTVVDGKTEPFVLYKITSSANVASLGVPVATLWVDCRNPFENGITTQMEFY